MLNDKQYLESILESIQDKNKLNEWFEYTKITRAYSKAMMVEDKKCTQKCRGLEKEKKRKCKYLCWMSALQKAISTMKSLKNKCREARNPEKCLKKLNGDIIQFTGELNHFKSKLRNNK
jgi:hypothetical protein